MFFVQRNSGTVHEGLNKVPVQYFIDYTIKDKSQNAIELRESFR